MGDKEAVFWIASPDHHHEARQSMASVARCMPDLPQTLFDVRERQHSLWYLDYVRLMNEALKLPYDRLLFLDTDTYMIEPVPEIFEILDWFDIASTIAPARVISPTSFYIPASFAEYNTGVLAFQNSAATKTLFWLWYETYKDNPDLYGENDQAPLREAIWKWSGRPYVLPFEYNCRFGFGGQAAGPIKILHGRSNDMAGLAARINSDTGIRGWRRGDFS